jgi:septum formation protein
MSHLQPRTNSFILASQSPRRRHLLQDADYVFDVIPSDVDESVFDQQSLSPRAYAECLALAKASAVSKRYPSKLVVGADTIVDLDGQIIGKPRDARDAEAITRQLFSRVHTVITAVALVRILDPICINQSACTRVFPKPMTEQQIADHIHGSTWQDKAGAYAIQENGDRFIERLEGSFTNVVGLPMELLVPLLEGVLKG